MHVQSGMNYESALQALVGAVAGHALLREAPAADKQAVKDLRGASEKFQAWIHEGAAIAENSDQVRSPCAFWKIPCGIYSAIHHEGVANA